MILQVVVNNPLMTPFPAVFFFPNSNFLHLGNKSSASPQVEKKNPQWNKSLEWKPEKKLEDVWFESMRYWNLMICFSHLRHIEGAYWFLRTSEQEWWSSFTFNINFSNVSTHCGSASTNLERVCGMLVEDVECANSSQETPRIKRGEIQQHLSINTWIGPYQRTPR